MNVRFPTTRTFSKIFLATAITALAVGCRNSTAPVVAGDDPAIANLAPVNGQPTRVLGQSETYNGQQTSENYAADPSYDQGYNNGVAQGNTVYEQTSAPPPLRRYEQPAAPGPGYVWTPGYWGSSANGYVWVNGSWVRPPQVGSLWTPPYWAYTNSRYRFHHGYWGPHVGYYGGVDYGNGYIGTGYYGGYWHGNDFYYNTAVTRLGPGITFSYNRPVLYRGVSYGYYPHNFISYNGGPGGVAWAPQGYELAAMRERHFAPVGVQVEFGRAAGIGYARGFEPRGGVVIERGFVEHPVVLDRRGFVEERGFREERGGGHFDNGWHGHDHGGERGEWHGGGGHGEDHGGGHGHGR